MEWILAILIILLVLALVKISLNYLEIRNINEQLKLIIEDYSSTGVKVVSGSFKDKKLVSSINQFLILFNDIKKKYQLSDQQNKLMIASISHDFRTPLTSILGYIQILNETDDEAMFQEYLEIIEKRIKSLSVLIEEFYALSLLQSSEYPLNIRKTNPSLVLVDQIALYYHDLNKHFATLLVEIDESQTTIQSDSLALGRILSNLIKNSLVHGQDTCIVNYQETTSAITISIRNKYDTTQEINLDKIFERTYREDQSRHLNSSGLGLSIAKQLSELLNFSLHAEIVDDYLDLSLVIPLRK